MLSLIRLRKKIVPHGVGPGFWQGIVILAPLVLLGALGVRGLQLSRQNALDEARRQIARVLDQSLPTLLAQWGEIRRTAPEVQLYSELPVPAPQDESQVAYAEAINEFESNPTPALETLVRLEKEHPDALAASGVPLLPLVEWTRLRLESDPVVIFSRATTFATVALRSHPSILTPELLAAAESLLRERGVKSNPLAAWRLQWQEDERMRVVWRRNEAEISAAKAPSLWVADESGQMWWTQRSEDHAERKFLSRSELQGNLQSAFDGLRPLLPDYAAAGLLLDGSALWEARGEALGAREVDGITLQIVLAEPDRLYAQQRQQTFWLAALLACAMATALAGFLAMRRALVREQRLGQLKSDFVSSVSHELRAPVASMRLMAENLETGAVYAESRRREYHQLIAEECRRLSALIDNVLDFARIEQDRKTYDLIETDAAALVRDALQFMAPRATQRRQEIILDEAQVIDPPPVCDGLAVRQAVLNLLDNAIKFSPANTVIRVCLRARGPSEWEIVVRDEGPGIPAAEHERIFERFYRLGSELRRETQGAGIGLSIVWHIAQAHGGRVELASRPGAGAAFSLVLPINVSPDQ